MYCRLRSLAQTASFSDLNTFVLDFYFFHVHTACCIQLHEEGIKKHAEEKLLTVLLANFYPQRSARDGPLPPPQSF